MASQPDPDPGLGRIGLDLDPVLAHRSWTGPNFIGVIINLAGPPFGPGLSHWSGSGLHLVLNGPGPMCFKCQTSPMLLTLYKGYTFCMGQTWA